VEPDPELRQYEWIPLDKDVNEYMEREVLPFAPDAWAPDPKGREGYELPLTKLFYRFVPPRPLEDVDADLQGVEDQIQQLLAEVTQE
jgi:type I restriction enzyme M protein